jgi:hypothetical protein
MPYVSPIKLLSGYQLPVELKLDKDTLRIARQALLAEIDLSSNQTVELGGKLMTRNDVLQLFDAIQGNDQLRYHEAIHADAALLDFFTEGKVPVMPLSNNPVYQEPGFVEFIASFYPEMFFKAFEEVANRPSFERISGLFALPAIWNSGPARRETEKLVKGFLLRLLNRLHQIVEPQKGKTGINIRKNTIEVFYNHSLIDLLNKLPDSYTEIRTNYGVTLLELAYILWNNKKRAESNIVARRAELLKGSYDLEYQVKHYWSQCSPSQAYEDTSDGTGVSPWSIIIGIFFIIRLIIAISQCDSRSSSRSRAELPVLDYEKYRDARVEAMPEEVSAPSGSRASAKKGKEKKAELPPEPKVIEFFDPKTEPADQVLHRLDSFAQKSGNIPLRSSYDQLYRAIKSDTIKK